MTSIFSLSTTPVIYRLALSLAIIFLVLLIPELVQAQVFQKLEDATKSEVLGGTFGQIAVAAAFVFVGLMFLFRIIDLKWVFSIVVGAFFIAGAVYISGILFGYFS